MAPKKKQSKRKRKKIPSEAYIFIENLERLLEIRFSPNGAENINNDQGSHSHYVRDQNSTSKLTNISSNMIQEPPTTNEAPFMGLPTMELIEKGLENVDSATLRQSIDPIWKSLESLDAMAMLSLKQTDKGARVADGYVSFQTNTNAIAVLTADNTPPFR